MNALIVLTHTHNGSAPWPEFEPRFSQLKPQLSTTEIFPYNVVPGDETKSLAI